MHLLVIGLDQGTASLQLRERCRWAEAETAAGLAAAQACGLSEAALLCTCNRTEIYGVADDPASALLALSAFLAKRAGQDVEAFLPHLYRYVGVEDTAAHLFRVASGLQSLVLGETQVLGQVKQAYLRSAEAGGVGKLLHGLFHQALACAKAVHAETGLAESPVSVGAAAVDLARRHLGGLEGRHAVLVGAGDTADTVARRLQEAGLAAFTVVNRGAARGRALAAMTGADAVGLDALPALLRAADLVIASTASAEVILGREAVAAAMADRAGRPLLLIDIAVPRDIDPAAGDLIGVRLANIDDLEEVAAAGRQARRREVALADQRVAVAVRDFDRWWRGLDAVPLIRALEGHYAQVAEAEVERILRRQPELTAVQQAAVREMAHRITANLANGPMQQVRRLAREPGGQEALRVLARAFGLDLPAVTGLPTRAPGSRASGD